jgi:hypothetical protein
MPDVIISHQKVQVGDTAVSLLSGEVHYWRIDPSSWRPALERVKEMGIRTVATYACWDFHQIAPVRYDFTGETDLRRDLISFLQLLTAMDFWIIFRPGPYIYSEWSNNGVPYEAARFHRLDPRFQALAEHYMTAVTECVKPFLATTGGRVILWQADNEIDPWPHLYAEALGLGRKPGIFHDYLREKYPEVAALNAAWRTSYSDIQEARAVSELFREDAELIARYNDYRDFLHWYVNKVAAWATGVYRRLGVDVPIILNTYSGVGTQVWAELEQIADLVGCDIYPSREYLYRTGEHRHILEAMRYARTYSKAPYVAEFEAGIWHDWLGDVGTLTPNHYRLICLAILQGGAVGWNWYMLVNRDNWYQSPINEWGRTRPPLFEAFRQITALYDALEPASLEKIVASAVTFDPLQRSTTRPGQDLLQSFHSADIDYEFFDLTRPTGGKPVTFYAGGPWLSADSQRALVDYVENGGHLLFVGAYPKQDEHLHPLNLLGIAEPSGIVTGQGSISLALFGERVASPWFWFYDETPGEPIMADRAPNRMQASEELVNQFALHDGLRYSVGYRVKRGQGTVTVIGLQPTPALMLALHRELDVPIPSRSLVDGVTSALFRRGNEYFLVATNEGTETKGAVFAVPGISGVWKAESMFDRASWVADMDGGQFNGIMRGKDGEVFRLSQAGELR